MPLCKKNGIENGLFKGFTAGNHSFLYFTEEFIEFCSFFLNSGTGFTLNLVVFVLEMIAKLSGINSLIDPFLMIEIRLRCCLILPFNEHPPKDTFFSLSFYFHL